jgi:Apea-like HEPN
MAFTVVPLHNLSLPFGTQIPFGAGFILKDVPDWVKKSSLLNELSRHDRQSALDAKHALVAEYEAAAIGEPDREWTGKTPKSIQNVKFDSVMLANIALWLMQPSSVCFTVGFHALAWNVPGEKEKRPIISEIQRQSPLRCHPNDVYNVVSASHVAKGGKLHAVLSSIPRNNPVWEAMRAFWAALTMYSADRRYPFFWMGLESLFGANDGGEISYKLCQRIAFFLADDPGVARELFRKAKTCYNMRSKIIHGRWKNDPDIDSVMADTESIVRTVFRHILDDPEMLTTFISS